VTLANNPQIAGVVQASLSDIKQGSLVGITAMPQADCSRSALHRTLYERPNYACGEITTIVTRR
jgi:hypothetical protein